MKIRPFTGTGYLDGALSVEQSKEVFAHFGLAVHASNVAECAVLNALFTVEVFANIKTYKNKDSWEAAYDAFFDRGFSQTFGTLVRRIREGGKYSSDLVDLLEACTVVRNHLVHRSQREGAEEIFTDSGRAELIRSYESALNLFEAANDQIEAEILQRHKEIGIDATWFANRVEEAMRELVPASAT